MSFLTLNLIPMKLVIVLISYNLMSDSNSFFGLFGCLKKSNISKDVNGRTIKNNPLKPLGNNRNTGSVKGGRV